MKTLILVNLDANNGKALKRWNEISVRVLKELPDESAVISYHVPFDLKKCLYTELIENHVRYVISAGGDGTANMILNALFTSGDLPISGIFLGFIGLGSSNDILKPYNKFIGGIPVKIDRKRTITSDVGCVTYMNRRNESVKKFFLANSSMGVGASANLLFNRGDFVIRFLKSRYMNLAIWYTTLRTILGFKNFPVDVEHSGTRQQLSLSYLAVLKNPHVSGNLTFDQKIAPDDGKLGLNICEGMNKIKLITVLMDLSKGTFSGKTGRHSYFIKEAFIKTDNFKPLEMDGEVEMAKDIRYTILPRAIKILQ